MDIAPPPRFPPAEENPGLRSLLEGELRLQYMYIYTRMELLFVVCLFVPVCASWHCCLKTVGETISLHCSVTICPLGGGFSRGNLCANGWWWCHIACSSLMFSSTRPCKLNSSTFLHLYFLAGRGRAVTVSCACTWVSHDFVCRISRAFVFLRTMRMCYAWIVHAYNIYACAIYR